MSTMAYQGQLPFAFISYSHADMAKVESLLRVLNQNGRRFWYDHGIEYSADWQDAINERLQSSTAFILFMTNGIEQRGEIIREIRMAIGKRSENPDYRIFVIMLERVPIQHLFGRPEFADIIELFNTVQYISAANFRGITVDFLEVLTGAGIWSACMTPDELAQAAQGQSESGLLGLSEVDAESDYIYPYALPEKREEDGITFYALNVGETDPNAVYPICMDNQWVPPEFFDDPAFRAEGFCAPSLTEKRKQMQQYEVISALLHNWQVLINRASVFNSEAIADWYMGDGDNARAFCELLQNGSFVMYLMKERTPVERPRFDVAEEQFARWREICRQHAVYCIRMSWDGIDTDDEANSFEIARTLSMRMMNLLLTTGNDRHRLESFRLAMGVPQERAGEFAALWRRLRDTAVARDDERPGSYTRNSVYLDFLVRSGSRVTDCQLDYTKPFVCELKQIIDFTYMINLPTALHITPISSYESCLWDYYMSEQRGEQNLRVISADELYCAVINFVPGFLKESYLAECPALSLADIACIRRMPEWTAYLEARDASRKRASLNEIDFHDVEVVWRRFRRLTAACAAALPHCRMRKEPGSLSVIYSFGGCRLITVYREGSDVIRIRREHEEKLSDNLRENLVIEFVCGDYLSVCDAEDAFMEKLRLFEGILLQSGRTAYHQILEGLTTHAHEFAE